MSADDHPAVVRDDRDRIIVRGHAPVVAAALDARTYSSAVSKYLQVPNGLDGEQHAAARRLIDPFFQPTEIDVLEPRLVAIARDIVGRLAGGAMFDAVADLGARFAVRAQSSWLGWRADLEDDLLSWVADSRAAARAGDPAELARVAERFDDIIRSLLAERRARPRYDITTRIMSLHTAEGQRLTDAEIVSILRNWTGGDLSSIALCAGVVVHWLATHPEHQRAFAQASDGYLDAAIDEILRIDDPFVSNRRVATGDAEIAGCPVGAGQVVVLDWRAANRDPAVFGDPDEFAPTRNASGNLVYGIGAHVCPGRPLATRELRVLTRALLRAGTVVLDEQLPAQREWPPVAGYRTVPVRLHWHVRG